MKVANLSMYPIRSDSADVRKDEEEEMYILLES